jgi:hypothetical protein
MRGGHKKKDETHKRFFYYFKVCLVLRFEAIVADAPIIIMHTDIDIKIYIICKRQVFNPFYRGLLNKKRCKHMETK